MSMTFVGWFKVKGPDLYCYTMIIIIRSIISYVKKSKWLIKYLPNQFSNFPQPASKYIKNWKLRVDFSKASTLSFKAYHTYGSNYAAFIYLNIFHNYFFHAFYAFQVFRAYKQRRLHVWFVFAGFLVRQCLRWKCMHK